MTYGCTDFRTTPGVDEAEFLAWPDRVSGITWAPCEERLVGRMLITGQWGDKVFGMSQAAEYRDFRGSPCGCGRVLEFRLRTGFLNVNPFFAGGMHLAAMRAISAAPDMHDRRVADPHTSAIPGVGRHGFHDALGLYTDPVALCRSCHALAISSCRAQALACAHYVTSRTPTSFEVGEASERPRLPVVR